MTDNNKPQVQAELVSQEMQELVSYRPHWIVRRGNAIMLLILLIMLLLTWFVRYPDIIQGSARLVAIDAPKLLTAKTDGKLEKLLVTNEQEVQKDQPLAFLQSTARHEQVLALEKWIREIEPSIAHNKLEVVMTNKLPLLNELGEIQAAYQEFQNVTHETVQILSNGYYQQKRNALLQDLQYLSAIDTNAHKQLILLQQDFDLQQQEYKANEALAGEKIIAPLEMNQQKSKIITKEQGLEQLSAQLINNNMAEHNKRKEILEVQKFIIDQQQKFQSALLGLKSRVEEWKQRYIVVAPVAGKVIWVSFLQENQLLAMNQELFYVQPPQSRYYAELMAPQNGLGKIKTGQPVHLRVESYPNTEFGYLPGKVAYIANMPSHRDSFLIKVELPQGLQTNYNKTIFFRNNLLASAEVVTDNRRLFSRFWGQLQQTTQR
ncbi:MAG: HlyD family efflux transporter periplasmic adaptor subunit [Chitinophagaceae bacterium]